MNTEVKVIKNVLVDGVRFDLYVQEIPVDFLGMAADLKFSGPGQYLKMDFSDQIQKLAFDQQPVKMVKKQGDALVMGMTFKAGHLPRLESGVVASFFFDGDKDFTGFEKQVFSVYKSGARQDLLVKWNNLMGKISQVSSQSLLVKKTDLTKVVTVDATENAMVETNLEQINYAEIFSGENVEENSDFGWIYVLIILAVLLTGAILYFFNNALKKSRSWRPSLT